MGSNAKVAALEKVAALRPQYPKIPEGAFSLRDYIAHFGMTNGAARRELAAMVQRGELGSAIGESKGTAGHPQRVYWPVEVNNGPGTIHRSRAGSPAVRSSKLGHARP